jgi:hypothetical protein
LEEREVIEVTKQAFHVHAVCIAEEIEWETSMQPSHDFDHRVVGREYALPRIDELLFGPAILENVEDLPEKLGAGDLPIFVAQLHGLQTCEATGIGFPGAQGHDLPVGFRKIKADEDVSDIEQEGADHRSFMDGTWRIQNQGRSVQYRVQPAGVTGAGWHHAIGARARSCPASGLQSGGSPP